MNLPTVPPSHRVVITINPADPTPEMAQPELHVRTEVIDVATGEMAAAFTADREHISHEGWLTVVQTMIDVAARPRPRLVRDPEPSEGT